MATDAAVAPANGIYSNAQPYANADPPQVTEPAQNGNYAVQNVSSNTSQPTPESSASRELSHSEIAWYFVEQYYKTMSFHPEKLHLFYNRRSQFVYGDEAEKVMCRVGIKEIQDRVKLLDLQNCKVKVTNVDSQSSSQGTFTNIFVQVIGELSIRSAPRRKFVQGFLLAEQSNGYYILNDIFRYINEDEEVSDEAPEPVTQVEEEPAPVAVSPPVKEEEHKEDAVVFDTTPSPAAVEPPVVEPEVKEAEVPEPEVSTTAQVPEPVPEPAAPVEEPVAKEEPEVKKEVEVPAPEPVEVEAAVEPPQPEQPKEAEPAPVAETPASQPVAAPVSVPAQAPTVVKPAAPRSWAALVGGPKAATPMVPPTPTSAVQPKPTPVAQAQASAPSSADVSPNRGDHNVGSGGWQTAGEPYSRKQGRPQSMSTYGNKPAVQVFIKNVTEEVDSQALREVLTKFGKITYFDVNRQKNCAFADFDNVSAFTAAQAASPLTVGNATNIYVEERRRGGGSYGGRNEFNRGGMGRNRDGRSLGQRGYQKDGRGGMPRNRAGNVTPKGRPQAA